MTTIAITRSLSASHSRVLPALFAMIFGFGLVFGTGFASSDALHAAAHDSRHAFSFPCH